MNVYNQTGAYWEDLPGSYHGSFTEFSFADGHTQAHKWFATGGQSANSGNPTGTCAPVTGTTTCTTWLTGGNAGTQDQVWAREHATAALSAN